MAKQIHTANIKVSQSELPKIILGEFSIDFKNDRLNFHCTTQNVEFNEVKEALIRLRNEIDRQIINEKQCPFYTESWSKM